MDFCTCHRWMCLWVGYALEKKQRIVMNLDFSLYETAELEVVGIKIYGIKIITLFFDSSKRTKLYKSSRTITYHTANAI